MDKPTPIPFRVRKIWMVFSGSSIDTLSVNSNSSSFGLRKRATRCLPHSIPCALSTNVLVNNAGIATTQPFLEQGEDEWRSVIHVNLNGAWRVAQVVAKHMCDNKSGGSIINIASILGSRVAQQRPVHFNCGPKAACLVTTAPSLDEDERFNDVPPLP
jgi:NAD(P)-dependent dehydrogenase (short-subunit alcohol dehydrogenase family)